MSAENYESLQDHEERIKALEKKVRSLEDYIEMIDTKEASE